MPEDLDRKAALCIYPCLLKRWKEAHEADTADTPEVCYWLFFFLGQY